VVFFFGRGKGRHPISFQGMFNLEVPLWKRSLKTLFVRAEREADWWLTEKGEKGRGTFFVSDEQRGKKKGAAVQEDKKPALTRLWRERRPYFRRSGRKVTAVEVRVGGGF